MVFERVRKRDGRIVAFEKNRIVNAILKAAQATGWYDLDEADRLASKVINRLGETFKGDIPSVEDVQDTVEKVLMSEGYQETAKVYILYRADRARVREMNSFLMKVYEEITFSPSKHSDLKRENANIDADTPMGTMLKYGAEGAKRFNHLFLLSKDILDAHLNGDIHIHDLDFYGIGTTTCTQIDLDKLFERGFNTGHGCIRQPNDILSYSALACIALQSNQNDQHGGQSIPMLDFYLAKGVAKTFIKEVVRFLDTRFDFEHVEEIYKELKEYVKEHKLIMNKAGKDFIRNVVNKYMLLEYADFNKLIEKATQYTNRQTYQAMEALIHNLNTMHSRAGAQVPFSSVNYGTDSSEEGRMVIKNILLATEAGLGNGETPIFPIQIFKVKEGVNFNLGDPNYDLFKLACRVSAKRLYPNFSFIDAPFNLKYYKPGRPETEVTYMGCRTRVIGNVYDPTREIVTGRGNLSFTSINLPRLAILAGHGNIDKFFELLDDRLALVIRQLDARFRIQESKKVRNFIFLMGQGVWLDSNKLNIDDELGDILKHGTLTIGFIGLAEALIGLIGKHHGESAEAQELGLKIVKYMRDYVDKVSQERKMNYTLTATPAESLAGRFVKLDRKRFGVIPGITDKEYYTNSFHIPVNFKISAFKKLEIEAPYHALTNAGHISYIELDGDPSQNLEAFEKIVRYMKDVGIGYGAINHPVDRDPICGYVGIINDYCPKCGRKADDRIERIRRITGYLVGTLERFNNAKLAEVHDRVTHNIKEG